ncbi:peptidase inhibitor family I36 protein [Paractinoplanes toevensis]|uniref:Peptidase inhibitor family I36 n=1 Tax=Paractinoplanes toevensis TaxID=571911 RepID=A0A920BQL9_9ACTN|nr:peptidase inhibitor family I36 protein [Actinoplanes toevensis]GIM97333.1 hypothetical protein Ato02nite_091260 [Actinoplanes toevensis]
MRTRLFALFATVLLGVGVSLSGAAPALAAAGGTCSANSFCLYQWTGFGAQVAGDRWQTSLSNIYNHPNHCLNIAPATWDNGTAVADNSGSLQWRVNQDLWVGRTIEVFNWVNCNPGGGWGFWFPESVGSSYSNSNLSTLKWVQTDITLYHTITSVAVF